MHASVLRLYNKHDLSSQSPRKEYADRVRLQYEFARDNASAAGLGNISDIGVDPKLNTELSRNVIIGNFALNHNFSWDN